MSQDIAFTLAEYAASLKCKDLPPSAVTATKENIFDTLTCATSGSTAPGIGEMMSLVDEWGGTPQATSLVFGKKYPAHHAAWLNSAMAHANDFDDTHDKAMLHAGVPVIPAALAATELKGEVSGEDFLAGVAAGLDIICRLGLSTTIGIVASGWIYTSLLGYFGATAAAGRIMGLSKEEMVNAFGIAYSQCAGTYQPIRDSAITKRMQPGFAAKGALISVQMAKKGIYGVQNTFQGVDGFYRVYLQNQAKPEVAIQDLGVRFEQEMLSYKPYPCCRVNHTSIDAAIEAKKKWNLSPEQIRKVEMRVNKHYYSACCTPIDVRKAPRSPVEAQFSTPYTVAAGLLYGRVGLADFTKEGIKRKEVLDLAARVDGVLDEEIEKMSSAQMSPVVIRIETVDGKVHELRMEHTLGSPEKPMTQANFDAKLADCITFSAKPLPEANRLRSIVEGLETLPDVKKLIGILSNPN